MMRPHHLTCCIPLLLLPLAPAPPPPPPNPVAAYALSPFELELLFDQPLNPDHIPAFINSRISFATPRPASSPPREASLQIVAARLLDHGKRLELITDPHPVSGPYTLRIPQLDLNLSYRLNGIDLQWDSGPDPEGVHPAPAWTGWWPSLDPRSPKLDAKRINTHNPIAPWLQKPGSLHLHTRLKLDQSPARITLHSPLPLSEALCASEPAEIPAQPGQPISWLYEGDPGLIDLELRIPTGQLPTPVDPDNPLTLRLELAPVPNNAPPVIPGPDRFVLPWVPDPLPPPPADNQDIPDLAGGDPAQGETVFTSAAANCLACHRVGNQGADIGPDLSSLADRDPAWIYRQIANPSAEISPEYRPYTVVLRSGRILAGLVRARDADTIRVLTQSAGEEHVPRAEIAELRPSATSIMPVGLAGAIGLNHLRDLVAFLKQQHTSVP